MNTTVWRAHFLTHSDVKPYNCDICHKGFVQTTAYKNHMKNNHGELISTSTKHHHQQQQQHEKSIANQQQQLQQHQQLTEAANAFSKNNNNAPSSNNNNNAAALPHKDNPTRVIINQGIPNIYSHAGQNFFIQQVSPQQHLYGIPTTTKDNSNPSSSASS